MLARVLRRTLHVPPLRGGELLPCTRVLQRRCWASHAWWKAASMWLEVDRQLKTPGFRGVCLSDMEKDRILSQVIS